MPGQFVSDASGGGGGSGLSGLITTGILVATGDTTASTIAQLTWDSTNKRTRLLGSGTWAAFTWGEWVGYAAQNNGPVYYQMADSFSGSQGFWGLSSGLMAFGTTSNHPCNFYMSNSLRWFYNATALNLVTGIAMVLGNSSAAEGVIKSTSNATLGKTSFGASGTGAFLQVVETDAQIADTETAILIRRNVGGTLSQQRVTMGAADSGGTGFKVLRVAN